MPDRTDDGKVPWGYEAHNGPACWGALDPAFGACARGREQSPVDLAGAQTADLEPVLFDYGRTRVAVENTGRTISIRPGPGHGMVLDGVRHELVEFHFHHGSEHLVEGVRLPLELHLVHRSDSGSIAVVGVFFTEGAANECLAPVWRHLPAERGSSPTGPVDTDLSYLLPEGRTSWRYRGSLTTPPCSEGVAWIVFCEPLSMPKAGIEAFGALHCGNFRPVQPLGSRVLALG